MPCPRCAGMRVTELITEGGMRSVALRCLHCGDVTDPVIARNRRSPQYRPEGRARTPVYGSRKWDRFAF
jgi:hypothetical protein